MSRVSAKNISQSSKSNEEINVDSYPFYRLIPIKNIALKQEELRNKYNSTPKIQLPALNVIPSEQQNHYTIEYPPLNRLEHLEQVQQQVEEETRYNKQLEDQIETIKQNDELIQSQTYQLNSIQYQIQQLTETQNQHLHCYSHNNTIIQQQSPQIQQNCQTIYEQNVKIEEQRNELTGLKSQVEYHQQMLGAFNVLLQNPEYFTQLMMATSIVSMQTNQIN